MDLYRVFVWDGNHNEQKLLKALCPLKSMQGVGRHDIPDKTAVIYCSQSSVSAIAEVIQGFRGITLGDGDFKVPQNKMRALCHFVLDDNISLIELNDPIELNKRQLKPSQVVSSNRKVTQNISRSLFDENISGFTWWSTLNSSWENVTLFKKRTIDNISIDGDIIPLNTQLPVLMEAADILRIRI